jgi:hypothetical protein
MQQFKLILFGLLVFTGTLTHAEGICPRGLSGHTLQWAIAVCEVRTGTDDYESERVQTCLDQLRTKGKFKSQPYTDCKLNARYKKEWCRSFVEVDREKSVSACMSSEHAAPQNVRNGYVGG